ncbi:MAG: hypothetical protein KDB14_27870, partial [Planctomycetales bacterium]|nr:hypothetical protein [Planctomycetales bacterium]
MSRDRMSRSAARCYLPRPAGDHRFAVCPPSTCPPPAAVPHNATPIRTVRFTWWRAVLATLIVAGLAASTWSTRRLAALQQEHRSLQARSGRFEVRDPNRVWVAAVP